ncbi:MAG: IPT/TIG domain-containing protein [Syntrophorhabdales bacterium]|jgi:hypothetical protein
MRKSVLPVILVLVLIGLSCAVSVLLVKVCTIHSGSEFKLPLLAIGGVVLLLLVLAIVSMLFGVSGLSDKTQALALPEGSIRAVIALSLVVLFAILSVFLFDSLSVRPVRTVSALTETEKNEFLKNNRTATDIFVKEEGAGKAKKFTVSYKDNASQPADDLAKQLLTMIGTLLTAMVSFYFGTRAVASTSQAAGSLKLTPHVRGVQPQSFSLATGSVIELQILGDNLNSIKQAKIVYQGKQILATEVVSNDSVVKCKIPVDANTPAGKWDVLVIDSNSQTASLPAALEITA